MRRCAVQGRGRVDSRYSSEKGGMERAGYRGMEQCHAKWWTSVNATCPSRVRVPPARRRGAKVLWPERWPLPMMF